MIDIEKEKKRNQSHEEICVESDSARKVLNLDCQIIKVGVCAMEKKSTCAPMQEILKRLNALKDFDILIFSDDLILNDPVEVFFFLEL